MSKNEHIGERSDEPNVVSMLANLRAKINASQEKQRALEAALNKTQVWSKRWKELCHFLQGTKCDLALDIMEENEILLSLLTSLETMLQQGTSVQLGNGKLALLIEDTDLISELSQVIVEVKETITESTEILARSFPTVPEVEVEHVKNQRLPEGPPGSFL